MYVKALHNQGISVPLFAFMGKATSMLYLLYLSVHYDSQLTVRPSRPGTMVKMMMMFLCRFDMDFDDDVLYVYEIQLEKELRRKGLGKEMVTMTR